MTQSFKYIFKSSFNLLTGLILLLLMLTGCSGCGKKKLNETITLWKNDKIPYGTYYAFRNLAAMFPDAEITVNKEAPVYYKVPGGLKDNNGLYLGDSGQSAFVIIAPVIAPSRAELQGLFDYVSRGNHVFMSAMEFSSNVLDSLKLVTTFGNANNSFRDSLTIGILHPTTFDTTRFTYPGKRMDNSLTSFDSTITEVIGFSRRLRPNFVRFTYDGGGSLMIQFAPAAFTNFFLLHKDNKAYYDQALSYLPQTVKRVVWDDYFRSHQYGNGNEKDDFSAFSWMMKQPALAWMLWLLLLLFGLIYLFESKRKQRAVPVKAGLKNSSVDFVKTIGRLYFQRKDNKNLATKLTTHFLDQVRQQYNITTSTLDGNFEKKLSYKSGHTPEEVTSLVESIRLVQARPLVSDELLLSFSEQLDKFKNTFKDGR